MKLFHDLRRRRVFRLAGLYIVGSWIVIEVSSVFFPAWGIPDTALRYLFIAAGLLFPVALVFAWIFDITPDGIVRTKDVQPGEQVDLSLRPIDYALLSGLAAIVTLVVYGSLQRVADETTDTAAVIAVERIENSVAVLPFTNLDPAPDTDYFSDGVSEEILHRLSATRALNVMGWTSAKALGQSEVSPAEISEHLGVEYLLHGSIRRDRDYVRVTARLMDSQGLQIWSQNFDRKLEAIFVIQSEIASAVSAQIVSEIVSSGGNSTLRATDNMDAYNEYLFGRALTHAREADWSVKSEAAFRRAIELDPEFAPAYAGLAYSLVIMSDGSRERVEGALAAARQGLALDPDLALGHAMLGVVNGTRGFTSLEEAEGQLRRALELDPALSDAYNWLLVNLLQQGRLAEAWSIGEQGIQVDPLLASLANNVANSRANRGDYDGAMRALEPFVRLGRLGGPIIGGLSGINREYGRYVESLEASAGPRNSYSYTALGLFEEAERQAAQVHPPYIRILHQRRLQQFRGRHIEAHVAVEAFLSEYGYQFEKVGPDDQAWLLQTQVLAGDYAGAIDRFERLGEGNPAGWLEEVTELAIVDLINAIGFAYQQLGDEEGADRVLRVETARLAYSKSWTSPIILAPLALNASLRGDADLAFERLNLAVDQGWAEYYRAINDPRWGDVLAEPRFTELLKQVKANIDAQRAIVESKLQAGQEDGAST